ncbi:MAG: anthranilate synthase component I family protein [Bacteroidales bacterium]|nr:anthranilate synthase component I family protein [Bacteroidales bacterium]
MKLTIKRHHSLADLHTAVGLYLQLRDEYPGALLLESSDYQAAQNSSSFICLSPLSSISLQGNSLLIKDLTEQKKIEIQNNQEFLPHFKAYINSFEISDTQSTDGLFGYLAYDTVEFLEDVSLQNPTDSSCELSAMHFSFFRFVIKINQFNDTMQLSEFIPEGENSQLQTLVNRLQISNYAPYPFQTQGLLRSNLTDQQFMEMVEKARHHCQHGDVFQLVLSRRFQINYQGDDFQVYRRLRSINPSPYGFYFDFGKHRIFGSSPESQLKISNNKASLNPIAGTYRRSGADAADRELAQKLLNDPKENAEHAMLVDLARNDLNRSCDNVQVEKLKEVQYFSHVIHLVSEVSGQLRKGKHALDVVADTFPAGTLSGAPKHKAMQLIDKYESSKRGIYGGAVGFIGLNGTINLAILIRSFLSKNNVLSFQAGAGIVVASSAENELQEVNNKLAALMQAIEQSENKKINT